MPFYKGHTYWDNENVKRTQFKKANLHPEKVKSLQYQLGTREKTNVEFANPIQKRAKYWRKSSKLERGNLKDRQESP